MKFEARPPRFAPHSQSIPPPTPATVVWKDMTKPMKTLVHPVTPHGFHVRADPVSLAPPRHFPSFIHTRLLQQSLIAKDRCHGLEIPFIKTDEFSDVYDKLVERLRDARPRSFYPIIIDGASGGGKSRLAVELFIEVRKNMEEFKLQGLVYVCVSARNISFLDGDSRAKAVQQLINIVLARYAKGPSEPLGPTPTLETLVNSVFPDTEQRVALFLHLDEFQVNEPATAAILAEVDHYNMVHPQRPILLVCSGLYASHTRLRPRASMELKLVEARYLNLSNAYKLTRAAAMLFCEEPESEGGLLLSSVLLPEKMSDANAHVRYLVEDTGGWALACAQLGAELCFAAREMKTKRGVTVARLAVVEQHVSDRLGEMYEPSMSAAVAGLSSAGFSKLLFLAMSPISVSAACALCVCARCVLTLSPQRSTGVSRRAHQ